MPNAAIVGGGIGGLAAAVHLARGGWRVEVFERSDGSPAPGTALGLWPSALRALDAISLGDAVRKTGSPQTAGAFLRPDGSRIAKVDVAAVERAAGDPVHLLSRPELLRLLTEAALDAAGAGALHYSTPVEDVRQLDSYDVVVAADGLNSRARTALFGPAFRPAYCGTTAWRGTVDGAAGTPSETWGKGMRFGITSREGAVTNWFACANAPEGERAPGREAAVVRELFGGWHRDVREVLDRLDEDGVLRHDLYYLDPPLPRYTKGRTALIGDAAHAMTPDLGRGACEALTDAIELSRALLAADRVEDALAAYDELRRPPTRKLVRLALRVNKMSQMRRFTRVRDTAFRLALAVGRPPQ